MKVSQKKFIQNSIYRWHMFPLRKLIKEVIVILSKSTIPSMGSIHDACALNIKGFRDACAVQSG
jgi:hypothetical protein